MSKKFDDVNFKFLFVCPDSHRWVVVQKDEDVRAKFKEFHGRAAGRKAKLWIIPKDVTVQDDLSYTYPADAKLFTWVEVKGVH